MSSKSFSFAMLEQAWEGWKQTLPRDKPLHDAVPEDLARIALERDNGQLAPIQREACKRVLDDGEIDLDPDEVVRELQEGET